MISCDTFTISCPINQRFATWSKLIRMGYSVSTPIWYKQERVWRMTATKITKIEPVKIISVEGKKVPGG